MCNDRNNVAQHYVGNVSALFPIPYASEKLLTVDKIHEIIHRIKMENDFVPMSSAVAPAHITRITFRLLVCRYQIATKLMHVAIQFKSSTSRISLTIFAQ